MKFGRVSCDKGNFIREKGLKIVIPLSPIALKETRQHVILPSFSIFYGFDLRSMERTMLSKMLMIFSTSVNKDLNLTGQQG